MLNTELIPKSEVFSHTLHDADCLQWIRQRLIRFDVITPEKEDQVIKFLMEGLVAHIRKVVASGAKLPERSQEIVHHMEGA